MLRLESYVEHEHHLPSTGKFIIAQFDHDTITIYQAFKDSIADYAVTHQRFGGDDYDFNRRTWLKPSFLWMMYYSGWAKKENQENVLAIRMKREGFDQILSSAVLTDYSKDIHGNKADWQRQLDVADIHVQWEHYYDLFGRKTDRYGAKIGIRGEIQRKYNEEWILAIENITPYVQQQQDLLNSKRNDQLQLPHERAYAPSDLTVLKKLDATTISL